MTFQRAFFFFTYAAAVWAFLTMALFVELHVPAIIFFSITLTAALLRRRFKWEISSGLWLTFSVLVILMAFYGWFILQEPLYSVVYTFLYLKLNKLWTADKNRDYLQIYGLTFFEMLAAAVSTSSVAFAPMLAGYLFLILGALITVTIKGDAELAFSSRRIRVGGPTAGAPRRAKRRELQRLEGLSGSPYLTRAFVRTLSGSLIAIMIVGAGLFVIIPRLQAQSFVTGLSPTKPSEMISGFSDSIDFMGMGEIQTNPTIAARAIPGQGWVMSDGYPTMPLLRLRGTALDFYDGRRWSKSQDLRDRVVTMGQRREVVVDRPYRPRSQERSIFTTIHLEPNTSGFLFAPARTQNLKFEVPTEVRRDEMADSFQITPKRWISTLSYTVQSVISPLEMGEELGAMPDSMPPDKDAGPLPSANPSQHYLPRVLAERLVGRGRRDVRGSEFQVRRAIERYYLQLPEHSDIATVRRLASDWTDKGDTPAEKARKIEHMLKSRYDYSLDVSFSSMPNHLSMFLTSVKAGHCEYFATSMVLMLRAVGVPARIVNGYATDEWVPGGTGYFLVRQEHAHSWVEAYIPNQGWVTFDPTPVSGIGTNRVPSTLYRRVTRWIDSLKFAWYENVIDYDMQDQAFLYRALFKGMNAIPDFSRILSRGFSTRGGKVPPVFIVSILIVAGVLAVLLVREIRRFRSPGRKEAALRAAADKRNSLVIEPYRRLLTEAERRVSRPEAQTPLEYAQRVVVARAEMKDFLELTEIYYTSRFDGHRWGPTETERANALLRQLKEKA